MLEIGNHKKIEGYVFLGVDGGSYRVVSVVERKNYYTFNIHYFDETIIWVKIRRLEDEDGLYRVYVNDVFDGLTIRNDRVFADDNFDALIEKKDLIDISSTFKTLRNILES